jgi:hypothetical protein
MDIKYHILCKWVECNLLVISRVDTSVNMSNHFTKQLGPTLFHCHVYYIMGQIPPHYTQWLCRLFGATLRLSLLHLNQCLHNQLLLLQLAYIPFSPRF